MYGKYPFHSCVLLTNTYTFTLINDTKHIYRVTWIKEAFTNDLWKYVKNSGGGIERLLPNQSVKVERPSGNERLNLALSRKLSAWEKFRYSRSSQSILYTVTPENTHKDLKISELLPRAIYI